MCARARARSLKSMPAVRVHLARDFIAIQMAQNKRSLPPWGFHLNSDNAIIAINDRSVASKTTLCIGDIVVSINDVPVKGVGAALHAVSQCKPNSRTLVLEVRRLPVCAPPRSDSKRAAPAAEAAAKPAKLPKPSNEEESPLAAEHEQKRRALLAQQQLELEELKRKHAESLSKFEKACGKELINASGRSSCYRCGDSVPGVVIKPKHSFQSLPKEFEGTTCCYCQLTRKCSSCSWSVSCAYYPESHGFCRDCKGEANICSDCDGGCSKCQDDAGCCSSNGGRRR